MYCMSARPLLPFADICTVASSRILSPTNDPSINASPCPTVSPESLSLTGMIAPNSERAIAIYATSRHGRAVVELDLSVLLRYGNNRTFVDFRLEVVTHGNILIVLARFARHGETADNHVVAREV